LERGRTLPSFETLERLSERLQIPLKVFVDFGEEEDPECLGLKIALNDFARQLDKQTLTIAVRQIGDLAKLVASK